MSLRETVTSFASALDNVQIDNPFKKFPAYIVFRHQDTGKLFGLIANVEKRKLGINADDTVDIINIKADPEMISILKAFPGYLPAYHMNKNHWITILLDGSVKEKQIIELLKTSYYLTA